MVYRTDNIGGGEFPLRTARFTAEHNERRRQRQCVDQSLQSHRVFIRRGGRMMASEVAKHPRSHWSV